MRLFTDIALIVMAVVTIALGAYGAFRPTTWHCVSDHIEYVPANHRIDVVKVCDEKVPE